MPSIGKEINRLDCTGVKTIGQGQDQIKLVEIGRRSTKNRILGSFEKNIVDKHPEVNTTVI